MYTRTGLLVVCVLYPKNHPTLSVQVALGRTTNPDERVRRFKNDPAMSSTTVNSASNRGGKDTPISKRGGYSTLSINYKGGGRGAESKGYGRFFYSLYNVVILYSFFLTRSGDTILGKKIFLYLL